jgi:hypothetical protein
VQLPPLFYKQLCFPRAGVSPSEPVFSVPFFKKKKKPDGLTEVCLPFVVLKLLVEGRKKKKEKYKNGRQCRETQPKWQGHF